MTREYNSDSGTIVAPDITPILARPGTALEHGKMRGWRNRNVLGYCCRFPTSKTGPQMGCGQTGTYERLRISLF